MTKDCGDLKKIPWYLDLQKFIRYGLETRSFEPLFSENSLSTQAIQSSLNVRGAAHGPAIIIHGVMPRSGTVYVGQLLRLHPDLFAFPNQVWEWPFLQQTGKAIELQDEFMWAYEQNMGKIGRRDFLPLFGEALIAYLQAATPPGKRVLLKIPSVQYLNLFYDVFPHEHLLVLVRDGRDLVQSTLKTWPQLRFSMVATRYKRAVKMVVACEDHFRQRRDGYWLARYEDAVKDPESFVRMACRRFNLDPDRYPFEKIEQLRVRGSSDSGDKGQVSWQPVSKKNDFNPIGRWQTWSGYHKWLFKRLAGSALIDLGYAKDNQW